MVKHTECQQSVGKRLVTRGQCAHSSATEEECAGHSWPQNRQCSFGPSTLCTAIVSLGTLFARILCPFRFWRSPLFRTSRQGPPVQSGHSRFPKQLPARGSNPESLGAATHSSRSITDVYPSELEPLPSQLWRR